MANLPVFPADRSYQLQFYFLADRQGNRLLNTGKILLISRKGKVLTNCPFVAQCNYVHKEETKLLKGKLLTDKNGKRVPLANATVLLRTASDEVAVRAETNKYGDFELPIPDTPEQHRLRVELKDQEVQTIILASQDGAERSRFIRNGNGFEYKLIAADIVRLTGMSEQEDIVSEFNAFVASKQKQYKRSEFINYESGSYKIEEDSKQILEKISAFMNEHNEYRLEVISHTDSQGDDKSNLELSENRSMSVVSYLILVGVQKERLTYKGKGETEIRNRCGNGVDCSDAEHRYNRRTEFRFVKD
jgi:outer membrane protein OmpA-like peptidoglycan-associated protein